MIRAHVCFAAQGELDRHPPLHPSVSGMPKEDIGTRLSLQAVPKSMPMAGSEAFVAGVSLTVPTDESAMSVAVSPAAGNGGIMALLEQLSAVSKP